MSARGCCEWCGRRTSAQFVRNGAYVCWTCKLQWDLATAPPTNPGTRP